MTPSLTVTDKLPSSSLYVTPAGSSDKIAELALAETEHLQDNPFCQGQLEYLSLFNGLELLTVRDAMVLQDLSVYTSGDISALAFNIALKGYYGVQLPGTHLLMQQPQTILCGYHPELDDTFYCPKQDYLEIVALGITPLALIELAQGQSLPKIVYSLLESPENTVMMLPVVPLDAQLLMLAQQLLYCPYQDAIRQFYLQSKALELFALYLSLFDERKSSPKPTHLKIRDLTMIHEAKEYLLTTKQNPPSLTELARVIGINQDKLKRGFREVFGTTVFGCLREARLEEAYQLLLHTNLTVKAIAHQIGYADAKHFTKMFKAKFGKSPDEVRRGK